MLTKKNIAEMYSRIGLKSGDIVIVQASYKGLGDVEGKAEGFCEALLDFLGPTGTLIMPAYNHTSWTEGHYFDVNETPTDVGIIPEVFRRSPASRRTQHPIHSLSVAGALSEALCSIEHQDSFGADSIYKLLMEKEVLCTSVGLAEEMAFLPCHYTETLAETPYRRLKNFSGIYVNESGTPALKTYGFHVRKDMKRPGLDPYVEAHQVMEKDGIIQKIIYEGVQLNYCPILTYHNSFMEVTRKYPEMFV